MRCEDRLDNSILREEASRTDDRSWNAQTRNRNSTDHHHPVGDWDQLAQTTHATHVLLVRNGMDNRTGAKEQKCLEECMREEVKYSRAISADTQSRKHITKLRTGRVSDNALDVVLYKRNCCSKECCRCADNRHDQQCGVRMFKDRRQTCNHEHTRGHHRCRVNKCGNRCRAFHRVRKPCVQQELRGLTHRTHEKQQANNSKGCFLVQFIAEEVENNRTGIGSTFSRQIIRSSSKDRVVIDRLEQCEQAEDTEQEAEVTNAVDNEGFHCGGICRWLLEPETDQKIGCQTHTFPAEEHLNQIVRRYQHKHGEGEERQIGKEARTMRIVVHISNRIDMHECRHRVDHDKHDAGQRIDAQRPIKGQRTGRNPMKHGDTNRFGIVAERDLKEHDP